MIFKFKDMTEYDSRTVYDLRVVKETDDGFVFDCLGEYREVKRKDIEILKEDDMADEEKRKAEEISEKLNKIIDEKWNAMGDALIDIFTDAMVETFNLGTEYPGAHVSAEEDE